MKREIIKIDREKCNGCGICVPNCHEGALQIIDGKATLVSELMCDGLGACIGHCPEGAIEIETREAEEYNETEVMKRVVKEGKNTVLAHLKHLKEHNETKYLTEGLEYLNHYSLNMYNEIKQELDGGIKKEMMHKGGGCMGSLSRTINKIKEEIETNTENKSGLDSELKNWPIQLHLINPNATYFKDADVLLTADCVAYASGDYHKYLKDKIQIIACPKLDSNKDVYIEKLRILAEDANIKSLTVMKMEVPCCGGLLQLAQIALNESQKQIPLKTITISINGAEM